MKKLKLLPWQSHNAGKRYVRHRDRLYIDHNGRYYVRVGVPRDLRQQYKHNTVVRYLGTGDVMEARRLAAGVVSAIRNEFEIKRHGSASPSEALNALRHVAAVFRSTAFEELAEGGSIEALHPNVAGLLADMGVTLNKAHQPLAPFFAHWGQALAQERIENRAGAPPAPAPWHRPAPSGEPVGGFTVMDALAKYEATKNVRSRTLAQTKTSVRLFVEHVGDTKQAIEVSPEDATSFKDKLARISPDYRRAIRNGVTLTLAEMEARFAAPLGRGLSNETINRHLSNLRSVFEVAKARGLPKDHKNPFEKTSLEKPKGRRRNAQNDAEVAALLKGAPLTTKRVNGFKNNVRWVVAIAALHGMRQGEILALTKDDVATIGDVTCLRVMGEEEGAGKTPGAKRTVPLHPLIRAKLQAYAAKVGKGHLFPAANFSSRFTEYRRACGVTREKVDFHSLRHSVITKLRAMGCIGDDLYCIVGHTDDDDGEPSLAQRVYTEMTPELARRLGKFVAKISYKGVKLA